ncbi:MAG: hypothetical protein IIV26_07755, partial [Peptococcaceae bacterium]|nr:hypothetical protein [Peptococcaceae bacterium]
MKNKKTWIAALLLLTFLCMSVMPGAVFADTTSSPSAAQTESAEDAEAKAKAEEEAKKREEAAKKNVLDTGLDPLWAFMNIEVPDKVMVGQKFDVKITVRNTGSGPGLFPVFRFTEDAERKPLSHFTVIGGGENGEYDTLLTEVPSGETKTFT